jgi:hypothetical protein
MAADKTEGILIGRDDAARYSVRIRPELLQSLFPCSPAKIKKRITDVLEETSEEREAIRETQQQCRPGYCYLKQTDGIGRRALVATALDT